ncbi:MAG: GHKL domain-containing protein [Lachnospiraceae bacterium]|nr:GHKL domain-containing protein [Lachnospiraceae bacterium]
MTKEHYEMGLYIVDLYEIVLQILMFIWLWEIIAPIRQGKKKWSVFICLFSVNLASFLWKGHPVWLRHLLFVLAVLSCYMAVSGEYKGLKKGLKHNLNTLVTPVFIILLFYNLNALSFLMQLGSYQPIERLLLADIDTGRSMEDIVQYYHQVTIGVFIQGIVYTFFFVTMVAILSRLVKRPLQMNGQDMIFLSVLNIVGRMFALMIVDIVVVPGTQEMFYLFEMRTEMAWKIPCVALLLFAGEVSAIYIYQRYHALLQEREQHFMEKQQVHAMKERMEEVEHFYDGICRMKHEMRNHLTNVKGLAVNGSFQEMEQYVEKMDKSLNEFGLELQTGNAVTDVIINDRKKQADRQKAVFQAEFAYPKDAGFDAYDIGIILSNLLRNALEACESVKGDEAFITLIGKRKKRFFWIEVVNSFCGKPEFDSITGLPVSTKEEHALHGIGLSNVKYVAEKYMGDLEIQIENNEFHVMVLLQENRKGIHIL